MRRLDGALYLVFVVSEIQSAVKPAHSKLVFQRPARAVREFTALSSLTAQEPKGYACCHVITKKVLLSSNAEVNFVQARVVTFHKGFVQTSAFITQTANGYPTKV